LKPILVFRRNLSQRERFSTFCGTNVLPFGIICGG
jgi:hypothetical protein